MAKQDKKSFFSDWLEKLQQESWQLELLISGLALFGIYESQDLLIEIRMHATNNSDGLTRVSQTFFIAILSVGWKIFFINLLVHIILRGLWIGAIGLRYVSQDIDYDSLNYSEFFTNSLRKKVGEFDDFIERLEKICSVLFAYTFLLFLLFFSLSFFFFQLIVLSFLINDLKGAHVMPLTFVLLFYLLFGFIVFVDFLGMGFLKKIKDPTINKIYNAIFTFYSWTTLTFLYRPLLYNFLDNRYTKRLFYFSIPYILIILFASDMISNNNFAYFPDESNAFKFGNSVNRLHYEDLRRVYLTEVESHISKRRQLIPNIVLNKYMNDEDYLTLFLKMDASDFKLIQSKTEIEPYYKPGFYLSLFSSNKNKDSFYKNNRKAMEQDLDILRKRRRDLKKEKRTSKDTTKYAVFDAEIDSINTYIEEQKELNLKKNMKFAEDKQTRVINAFMDLVDLEIDDSPIEQDLDCYFFKHNNNDEKGIMCLYPMDSLSFGKHILYFSKEKSTLDNNKPSSKLERKIPFYKVKNFN